ncbi:hypothetical protein H6S82_09660 [Planktothrix sp. FACHB-1355]|uniref:Uncharacterized protein n=1 Tax=Aerosakkonema funiforme FACHB-1375 TaxID=2949571 RepID=A0A926VB11_9CYAN|nr:MULTISPECIES: hypothetical protein [Oscillatoriales]MBD2180078.1 hypothetical protein [Aerosakkonema funiforme FACHB-1375]MBD3559124.1 hypothetical protein [Planktothrix sp. FACHB-1355]
MNFSNVGDSNVWAYSPCATDNFDWTSDTEKMRYIDGGWEFDVSGTDFEGTFRIEIDEVPEVGEPQAFLKN